LRDPVIEIHARGEKKEENIESNTKGTHYDDALDVKDIEWYGKSM